MSSRMQMAGVAGLVMVATVGTARAGDIFNDLRPGTVYGAASLGVLQTSYECDGAAICSPNRAGGKLFGGYRFTPNLATEVGFYYLGKFEATSGANVGSGVVNSRTLSNKAVSIGIDWSNELFWVLTQHIRFGIAKVTTDGTVSYGSGVTANVHESSTKPFIGLGLSYQFNPNVRFYQSYDIFRNKQNEHIHVFSMGLGIEN